MKHVIIPLLLAGGLIALSTVEASASSALAGYTERAAPAHAVSRSSDVLSSAL